MPPKAAPPPVAKAASDPSLSGVVASLSERYDPTNADHTAALRQLWELAWPDVPWGGASSLIDQRWTQLGFQRDDPASDLRGAGIAGVHHLTSFLRTHGDEYRAAGAAGPDHCVALASLNLCWHVRPGASAQYCTGCVYQPPACCTYRRHRAAAAPQYVPPHAYQPRACRRTAYCGTPGLNLTLLLRAYLRLHREGETLQPVCAGGNSKGSLEMRSRFLRWQADSGRAFELLHGRRSSK